MTSDIIFITLAASVTGRQMYRNNEVGFSHALAVVQITVSLSTALSSIIWPFKDLCLCTQLQIHVGKHLQKFVHIFRHH